MSHWYKPDGTPAHFREDGKDTTLRDARRENLFPSVTEISNILAAPGLTQWILNQHLEIASQHLSLDGLTPSSWMSAVKKEASDRMAKARDFGTEVHDALEKSYKYDEMVEGFEQYIEAVDKALADRYGLQAWVSEKTFAHLLGFGGMVDLSCLGYVIDFKNF